MTRRLYATLAGAAWALAAMSPGDLRAQVPPPAETPARIVVSGRTSTARDIAVVKVGQEIPKTYSERPIGNTSGFEWYVSEHYALKSQMDENFSRMVLEVSELALPHWKAMTGLEPPDENGARMLIVYAQSAPEIVRAIQGDLGFTWSVNGGGVTWWGAWGAYNYPSGTLQYHLKDLMIHENLHMLQGVALRNTLGLESFTYGGAQHVYDSAKKQLTVMCFDRAPINNFTDQGLAAMRREFVPLRTMVEKHWDSGGELGTLYSHFFWSDPDRFLRWKIWRDEYYAGRVNSQSNPAIMEDIFGSLDRLSVQWERWVRARRATFHHVDWGWEQEGNRIWAYGFPWDQKYWSQMDIMHAPGERVKYDPLRMDYPAEPRPPIVGPVKRGVAEPSVGYVADLSGGGWIGYGLGVSNRGMCKVVLTADRRLVIEGKDLPVPRREFPLTPEVRAAGEKAGQRYGVTIQIRAEALAVTVRSTATNRMDVSVPLTPAVREALLNRPMALVARDGRPQITPFFDDARRMDPDLTQPAAANRWRFPAMDELETLYRAAWRLKHQAPASLHKLMRDMLQAVDGDSGRQAAALEEYERNIAGVAADVRRCSADPQTKMLALAELAGVELTFAARRHELPGKLVLETRARGRLPGRVSGKLSVTMEEQGANAIVATHELRPLARAIRKFADEVQVADTRRPVTCTATAELRWRGAPVTIVLSQVVFHASVPVWWTIGPFDNRGDGTVDTPQAVEAGAIELTNTYVGAAGRRVGWEKVERTATLGLLDDWMLDYAARFGGQNVSAYAVTWIESPKARKAILAVGSDDGVVVWLNGRRVHRNLVSRGYAAGQDRVPIRLNAGRNELRVKVMQGHSGWAMGVRLLDGDGGPLIGVAYPDPAGSPANPD